MNRGFPFFGQVTPPPQPPPTPPVTQEDETMVDENGNLFSIGRPGAPELVRADRPPTLQDVAEVAPVPPYQGDPGDLSANRDATDGRNAAATVMELGAPLVPNPTGRMRPTVMPRYTDMSLVGKDNYEEYFKTRPQEIEGAIQAGADAESDLSRKRADWIGAEKDRQSHELAVLRERQIQRQQEVMARQEALNQATERYSNDLADRGQFWRQPGSLMAAMGAALIAMSSPGDRGVGARIIDQAVTADWSKRRDLANMHLGELRSNVAAYRQIMGDANAGDQMAFLESKRVALMELERLANQFQGPLARANAAKLIAAGRQELAKGRMKLQAELLTKMEHFENPAIAAETRAVGEALPGEGPTPVKGSWKPGTVTQPTQPNNAAPWLQDYARKEGIETTPLASKGSGAAPGGVAGAVVGQFTSGKSAPGKGGASKYYMSDEQRNMLNKRFPGAADNVDTVRRASVSEILAKIGANPKSVDYRLSDEEIGARLPPEFRKPFNVAMVGYRNWTRADNSKVSAAMAPIIKRVQAYRQMGKDLSLVKEMADRMTAKGIPTTPDQLLGTKYKQVFGAGNWKKISEWMGAGEGKASNANDQLAQDMDQAIRRVEQGLNGGISAWVQDISGGTVSEGETKRNDLYINGEHSYNSLLGFHKDISRAAHGAGKVALKMAESPLTQVAWEVELGAEDPGVYIPQTAGAKGTALDPDVQRAIEWLKRTGGAKK